MGPVFFGTCLRWERESDRNQFGTCIVWDCPSAMSNVVRLLPQFEEESMCKWSEPRRWVNILFLIYQRRLKYTRVHSQKMAFTQRPSLSNNPNFLNSNYLIFRSARTSCTTVIHPPARKENLDQLYSCINHHRTTTNLSDIVWCMSGGVWWCLLVSMYIGWYYLNWLMYTGRYPFQFM